MFFFHQTKTPDKMSMQSFEVYSQRAASAVMQMEERHSIGGINI